MKRSRQERATGAVIERRSLEVAGCGTSRPSTAPACGPLTLLQRRACAGHGPLCAWPSPHLVRVALHGDAERAPQAQVRDLQRHVAVVHLMSGSGVRDQKEGGRAGWCAAPAQRWYFTGCGPAGCERGIGSVVHASADRVRASLGHPRPPATPLVHTSRFWGLRSRCITPCLWQCARPLISWYTMDWGARWGGPSKVNAPG